MLCILEELKRNQVADGVSLGARHILVGKFKIYKGAEAPKGIKEPHCRIGLGYAFDAEDGCVVTHPEHDHFKFTHGVRIQVMHQLDMRTLQRARD
jgi:hypothetical protein